MEKISRLTFCIKAGVSEFDLAASGSGLDATQSITLQGTTAAIGTKTISDNGIGIKPDIQDRIFDPFFSTKDKSEGTGLGLSMVQRIIKDHNGKISFKSELDKLINSLANTLVFSISPLSFNLLIEPSTKMILLA